MRFYRKSTSIKSILHDDQNVMNTLINSFIKKKIYIYIVKCFNEIQIQQKTVFTKTKEIMITAD